MLAGFFRKWFKPVLKIIVTSNDDLFNRFIDSHKDQYIDVLREAVSIRSVSAEPEARSEVIRMVKWSAQKLTDLGVAVELRKIGEQVSVL